MSTWIQRLLLSLAALTGAALLLWPLFASADAIADWQQLGGQNITWLLAPMLISLILSDLVAGHLTTRLLAVTAALTAVAAAVRILGAGVAGLEPIWLVVILAGRALGPTTGFIVGNSAILLSAMATGGVGPWLPYQMVAAGWMGLAAGWLPKAQGRAERLLITGFGAIAAFSYGWLLNLWFWPTAVGLQSSVAFDPTASPFVRLQSWAVFSLTTSLGFDLPRAVLTATLLAILGPRLLISIRRASRLGRRLGPVSP